MGWMEELEAEAKTPSLLHSIFEQVTDGIVVVSKAGYVIGANAATEKLTGFSTEEMVGVAHFCRICQGMASASEEMTCCNCFSTLPYKSSFEMYIRTKDGQIRSVGASATRLSEADDSVLVVIMRDMSEQNQMEKERFQRLMTNYIIQAQEEERKRISRDLHDGVGQALYSILVGLNVINSPKLGEDVRNLLVDVQQMTARALEEIKSMAVELRPAALDDLGLMPAIRSYAKRYEETFGIVTETDVSGSKRRFSPAIETALYRICQEAMINVAKYADTDKVFVCLKDEGKQVCLIIRDHGRGFDMNQIRVVGTGLGLYGMKERAHLLGGDVKIESAPNQGTTISVTIPVNEKGEPMYVDKGTYR